MRPLVPALAFAASLVYAGVRYIGFGGVPLARAPLFVLDKAVALTALLMLGVALVAHTRQERREAGAAGSLLAAVHVLMSLPLLQPAYLAKLFVGGAAVGGLTALAEIAISAGAAAVVALAWVAWKGAGADVGFFGARRGIARLALGLIAAHCAAIGLPGWFEPAKWPGGLPPITLIAVVFLAAVGAVALGRRVRRVAPQRVNGRVRA